MTEICTTTLGVCHHQSITIQILERNNIIGELLNPTIEEVLLLDGLKNNLLSITQLWIHSY